MMITGNISGFRWQPRSEAFLPASRSKHAKTQKLAFGARRRYSVLPETLLYCCALRRLALRRDRNGKVAEWSNALDSKSSVRLGVPSVRIRPFPPEIQGRDRPEQKSPALRGFFLFALGNLAFALSARRHAANGMLEQQRQCKHGKSSDR
jgi:hypothetical protein